MRWNELGKFLIISLAIIGGFCVYISPLSNSIKQGLDLQGLYQILSMYNSDNFVHRD